MTANSERYEATVPDTLDLAARAALAVNSLTASADPDQNYETYLCAHVDQRPAFFSHRAGGPCLAKPVQALPMMRVMSGSTLRADYDAKMLKAGLDLIEDDGLGFVNRETEARPGESMGLNIMRERAERLHGKVGIETEAGEGTRVCLAFPANPDEQQSKQRFGESRRAGTTH